MSDFLDAFSKDLQDEANELGRQEASSQARGKKGGPDRIQRGREIDRIRGHQIAVDKAKRGDVE